MSSVAVEAGSSGRTRSAVNPDARPPILIRWPAVNMTIIATVIALVVTMPLAFHLGDSIYGYPGDSTGTIAIFWWFDYALHHGQPLLYNTMIGGHLGSGWERMYFGVIEVGVFAPLSFLFGSTVAYNLGVLSSWPLTALSTFLLARRLGLKNIPASFAALSFAFMPFHSEKAMGHVLETHMEVFPLFLLFALRWRQGGSLWNIVVAGAMAAVALWIDPYYAFILLALAIAVGIVSLVASDQAMPELRTRLIGHAKALAVMGLTAALGLLPAAFVWRRGFSGSAASISAQAGLVHRSLYEVAVYSARLKEFVLPWHFNPLVPDSLRSFEAAYLNGSNFTEATIFIGYTVMLLAVVGILFFRTWTPRLLGLAAAVAGFVMSQPPTRSVLGIGVPLPSYVLYNVVPFFRVYSRFAILVMLGGALLAGLGLAVIREQPWVARRPMLLVIPFLAIALEFNSLPPTHTYQLFPAPAEYQWLSRQGPGILIEYPLAIGPPRQPGQYPEGSANPNTIDIETYQYELYQQVHLHPLFNGAVPTTPGRDVTTSLEPYYGPGVAAHLAALDVHYVFVHLNNYAAAGFSVPRDVPGLTYEKTIDGTDIYIVSSG